MHKIKKGIKKKIKGKKGKDKEDDLFDPDQLAKFKQELDEKAAAAAAAASSDPHSHSPNDSDDDPEHQHQHQPQGDHQAQDQQDEEWQKFKLLTSGVDSILKKTSGDLDRIKSTSFFQRTPQNPTFVLPQLPSNSRFPSRPTQLPSVQQPLRSQKDADRSRQASSTNWVNPERDASQSPQPSDEKDNGQNSEDKENNETTEDKEELVKTPESPQAIVVEDDLFDTTLVDAVLTGDIKLAYIPDSPVEENDEDDPFDTSVALAVVKQIEEEEKKKKRQVNLGLAVNVLTGSGAPTTGTGAATKQVSGTATARPTKGRPRPHVVNLLGEFDASGSASGEVHEEGDTQSQPVLDIFDAVSGPDDNLDPLNVIPVQQTTTQPPTTKTSEAPKTTDNSSQLLELLSEFDVIQQLPSEELQVAESLFPPGEEDDLEDEFAALAAHSIHKDGPQEGSAPTRPPPPTKPPPPNSQQQLPELVQPEEPEEPEEDDPFDTKFVESLVEPVKSASADDDDFDFDPRAGEAVPEGGLDSCGEPISSIGVGLRKDLLGGSCSELSSLSPIRPESDTLIQPEIHDPFDTSVIDKLVPGRAELKLLEEELLTSQPQAPLQQATSVLHPPSESDLDFDDFDPRKDEVQTVVASVSASGNTGPPPRPQPPKVATVHPFDSVDNHQEDGFGAIKALTPQVEGDDLDFGTEDIDPFDTSSVSHVILQPGKAELKLLESELVSPGQSQNIVRFQVDTHPQQPHQGILDSESFLEATDVKPLTPQTNLPLQPSLAEPIEDPFDTSSFHQNNLLPGKAELKYLEKELLNSTQDFQPPNLPTFAPPPIPLQQQVAPQEEIQERVAAPLHPLEAEDEWDLGASGVTGGLTPLQPIQPKSLFDLDEQPTFDDPFDTSIAQQILPGKAELRILETELGFGDTQHPPTTGRRLSDENFDPRQTIHPSIACQSNPLVPQIQAQQPPQFEDPFDTTASDSIVQLPGKAELRNIEAELL